MQSIFFSPFPILTTGRLVLRSLADTDDDGILALRSDGRVNKYIKREKQASIEEARDFISYINTGIKENKWIFWAITLTEQPKLLGTICLWNFSADKKIAELGYELSPAFQGKGIMQEALQAVVHFAFHTAGIESIEAFTHKYNLASIRLLLKNRFILDKERKDEKNSDNVILTLSKVRKRK